MKHYAIDASFKFTAHANDPTLEDWLDDVVDHLEELGATDVAVMSEGSSQTFHVSLVVEAPEFHSIETVVGQGMGTMRAAFHKCLAATPDWPTASEALTGVSVSLVSTSQRVLVDA